MCVRGFGEAQGGHAGAAQEFHISFPLKMHDKYLSKSNNQFAISKEMGPFLVIQVFFLDAPLIPDKDYKWSNIYIYLCFPSVICNRWTFGLLGYCINRKNVDKRCKHLR